MNSTLKAVPHPRRNLCGAPSQMPTFGQERGLLPILGPQCAAQSPRVTLAVLHGCGAKLRHAGALDANPRGLVKRSTSSPLCVANVGGFKLKSRPSHCDFGETLPSLLSTHQFAWERKVAGRVVRETSQFSASCKRIGMKDRKQCPDLGPGRTISCTVPGVTVEMPSSDALLPRSPQKPSNKSLRIAASVSKAFRKLRLREKKCDAHLHPTFGKAKLGYRGLKCPALVNGNTPATRTEYHAHPAMFRDGRFLLRPASPSKRWAAKASPPQ